MTKKAIAIDKKKDEFVFEFFGPKGTLGCTIILPFVILLLMHWTHVGYLDLSFISFNKTRFWDAIVDSSVFCPSCNNVPLLIKCAAGVIAWFLF